jgi:hypothetical protein
MHVEMRVNGEVVIKMEVNPSLLSQLLVIDAKTAIKSTPLSKAQAEKLLAGLDAKSVDFLKRIAAADGWIAWGEMKQHFGIKEWGAFRSGSGNKITRAVRDILDNKSARLVWREEHEWEGLDEGEDEACKVYVDGAALVALREACGLEA